MMIGRVTVVAVAAMLAGCIPQGAERGGGYPPPPDPRFRPTPPPQDMPREGLDDYRRGQQDDDHPRDAAGGRFSTPGQRPPWEARAVTPDAVAIAGMRYTVEPGDTLRGIADRTGSASEVIAHANGLQPPYVVRAGQVLDVPAGRYHLVRAGQTGIGIARAYGVPWPQIIAANDLSEPYILRSGQRLLIPGIDARPASNSERAAAFTLDIDTILTGGEPAIAETARPAPPTRTARPVSAAAAVAPPVRFAGGFTWPAYGPILARFGGSSDGVRNNGVKIGLPLGTPIKAAADGTVAYVGDDVPGLGGLVMVLHGSGWTSVYGHAKRVLVSRGQAVKQGETIALSGDTGFAMRPELHFELRKGRVPVDPLTELPAR